MDPSKIMTPATGSIGSRFESQASIDEAKENKQKAWREAYARIGQEPPPEEPEEEYDPRTLYERLQAKKDLKKEEWDSKMKLSNQWRGIDSEEQRFLMEKDQEKKEEQRKLEERDAEELRAYREKQAAKASQPIDTPPATTSSVQPKKVIPTKPARKDVKSLMKGVVVKKKPKPSTKGTSSPTKPISPSVGTKRDAPEDEDTAKQKDGDEVEEKKRKLSVTDET
ncbi:hypothetical protein L486_07987 [Kwoniella mangroviensis CBS 10435]|uniref:FAM192A/Fyv6 N-terminal domain-containing protein n=1 Tax=Kwoniella mangroviensis CBS 10435 TaxID=1331196 RepID=A0A1B9IFM1_9TREE|nr:uncharacterized protein I203_01058 [Kwoniella mangroviensis CBS 8507]OCF54439.1 hypothetical protein L486_07987 [Kwoniella mangroviensis CBS 10435]OCF69204.1 hypothetical protein I203_01058 [Kwoniella mangroviensis CBS 8507]